MPRLLSRATLPPLFRVHVVVQTGTLAELVAPRHPKVVYPLPNLPHYAVRLPVVLQVLKRNGLHQNVYPRLLQHHKLVRLFVLRRTLRLALGRERHKNDARVVNRPLFHVGLPVVPLPPFFPPQPHYVGRTRPPLVVAQNGKPRRPFAGYFALFVVVLLPFKLPFFPVPHFETPCPNYRPKKTFFSA